MPKKVRTKFRNYHTVLTHNFLSGQINSKSFTKGNWASFFPSKAYMYYFTVWKCYDGSNTILSNIEQTPTSFFEHRTNSNVVIYWWLNSNTLFLASNEQNSNIEPSKAFTSLLHHWLNWLEHNFFKHRTNLNIFIYW